MKNIILVRHATAAPKGADVDDFTRSLRKKGIKECRTMVRWYRDNVGEIPDLLLSSPANRAIETAVLFAKGLGVKPKKIARDQDLYGTADPEHFLKILKALDDELQSVMVFGHDPAFSEFAQHMVDAFDDVLPKCSVFGFSVNRRSWNTLKANDGTLEYFESPEGIHQQRVHAKQARKEASDKIEKGIWNVLAEYGILKTEEEGGKAAKAIRKASAGVAKSFAGRLTGPAGEPAGKKKSRGETSS
jgi:phosphohistidine phosphatase